MEYTIGISHVEKNSWLACHKYEGIIVCINFFLRERETERKEIVKCTLYIWSGKWSNMPLGLTFLTVVSPVSVCIALRAPTHSPTPAINNSHSGN